MLYLAVSSTTPVPDCRATIQELDTRGRVRIPRGTRLFEIQSEHPYAHVEIARTLGMRAFEAVPEGADWRAALERVCADAMDPDAS